MKEYRRGLRQIMADGDSSVARSSESSGCNVMRKITWRFSFASPDSKVAT